MHDGATPEMVIGLAVAYDADVLEGLVAAGWLAAGDVRRLNLESALRQMPGTRLTGELHRRALEQEAARRAGFLVSSTTERLRV
jgi:hypothetical protein